MVAYISKKNIVMIGVIASKLPARHGTLAARTTLRVRQWASTPHYSSGRKIGRLARTHC